MTYLSLNEVYVKKKCVVKLHLMVKIVMSLKLFNFNFFKALLSISISVIILKPGSLAMGTNRFFNLSFLYKHNTIFKMNSLLLLLL